MKKLVILLMFYLPTNIYAQTTDVWEDPYVKSGAPGFSEYMEAWQCYYLNDYKNYIINLNKAAEKGNLGAVYNLSIAALEGNYVEKDSTRAVYNMYHAASKGYAPAQYAFANYYANGIISNSYKDIAVNFLIESAKQGYFFSKKVLANAYLNGSYGVPLNIEEGLKMTEECANAGDAQSQEVLGELYYFGLNGIERNYNKAFKWYTTASNNGQYISYFRLACMYFNGEGVEKNYEKAHLSLRNATFNAQRMEKLNSDLAATYLDLEGAIYLKEGKTNEATSVWKQMKEKFPEFIEQNKYNTNVFFTRTMYEHDENMLIVNKPSSKGKKVIVSDIDEQIPENAISGKPVFAVIITNENYKDEEQVPHAIHDGETIKQYCEKTLGIPQNNIRYVEDATLNNIRRELNWLSQVMDVYQGEASIIFYYAGHGIPDESNRTSYLLPVDGVGNDVSTGYSLDRLYADLSSKPAKSVVVLLDACFSGAKRDGGMLASARGVAIKAKQNEPKGNMVVISAAQGDETAYPYEEKGHGMFTYYLLKKIQETKGDVTLGDLSDYVTSEVKKRSVVVNGKMQTPIATASNNAADWRNWKLR